MMRNTIYLLIAALFLLGCNDDLLDTKPEDSLTLDTKWTENFMNFYANGFYPVIAGHGPGWGQKGYLYDDDKSDNQTAWNYNKVAAGQHLIPETGGGWGKVGDWQQLRRANFFLDGIANSDVSDVVKNHYSGVAKFWRAWFYFKKVKKFGDVTLALKTIQTDDTDILYGPRTPRKQVMDSVLADITFACENMNWGNVKENEFINKGTALALKSRICLHEGTFRKYHNLGDHEVFLENARDAAKELIDSKKFKLSTAGGADYAFNDMFKLVDMSGNSELILIKKYISGVLGHPRLRYKCGRNGLTKDMVDDYLNLDGTFYDGSHDEVLADELANRDPRLLQTIHYAPAGGIWSPTALEPVPLLIGGKFTNAAGALKNANAWNTTQTGYHVSISWLYTEWPKGGNGEMDAPIMRYAEVLLAYAEATAELGECTQDILDMTINALRSRVGMTAVLTTSPAQESAARSDRDLLDYSLTPLLEEIRRERRVELAAQGFRYDDLMRWKAGKFLEKSMLGMKLTGANASYKTAKTMLDANGYVDVYQGKAGYSRNFDPAKHYYFPLPLQSLVENPELKQNPGWE